LNPLILPALLLSSGVARRASADANRGRWHGIDRAKRFTADRAATHQLSAHFRDCGAKTARRGPRRCGADSRDFDRCGEPWTGRPVDPSRKAISMIGQSKSSRTRLPAAVVERHGNALERPRLAIPEANHF
jgi:hypothetical protein